MHSKCELSPEGKRRQDFDASFHTAKVQRENAELHKTSAWLAEQARLAERMKERQKWER